MKELGSSLSFVNSMYSFTEKAFITYSMLSRFTSIVLEFLNPNETRGASRSIPIARCWMVRRVTVLRAHHRSTLRRYCRTRTLLKLAQNDVVNKFQGLGAIG
jgi:hypothetical protein